MCVFKSSEKYLKFLPNQGNFLIDRMIKSFRLSNEKSIKFCKRALNGQPITATIETLVVTDTSVLDRFINVTGTNDLDTVFAAMRIYYAHCIQAVLFSNILNF